MNKLAIICAGHGGGDSGAVGQGTNEAAQTIAITNALADLIRADGRFSVHIVPHELGLVDSINYVNRNFKDINAGYALEIHKNSAVGGHGVEVWYYSGDSDSKNFAQKIQNGLARVTGLPNRGVKGDATNRWGSLGWIRQTKTWAGLAECGFITDGGDFLDPSVYARGLYEGFLELFGLPPKATPPAPTPTPTPTINYRVTNLDGKQIGAYKEELNAWLKYESVQGSARIFNTGGVDITGEMVKKYRPVTVPPAAEPEQPKPEDPKPPVTSDKDKEQDEKIGALQAAVGGIIELLKSFAKLITDRFK